YQVLDKFHWTKDDMESVMLEIQNGKSPKQAAADWIKKHKKLVDSWYQ
ncbi:MAG: glycine betaine ABC transporter substrate-binding protein, partial [Leuconostoc falkenbergense]